MPVDTALPEIEALVVLLGAERRVPTVPLQQFHLPVNGLPQFWGKAVQGSASTFGIVNLHRERFALRAVARLVTRVSMWAIISSALSKGPKVRPALMSAKPSASRASMTRRWSGVYSSSAAGRFGRIVITPPDILNTRSCPLLRPARRRTPGGTTSGVLLLTVTVKDHEPSYSVAPRLSRRVLAIAVLE